MIFNRTKQETRTEKEIRAYFRRVRAKWAAMIAAAQDRRGPWPREFLDEQEELLTYLLLRRATDIARASARDIITANDLDRGLLPEFGEPVTKQLLKDARAHAKSVVSTTVDLIGPKSDLRRGDDAYRRKRLATAFSDSRAEGLAITHTTASRSAGQLTIATLLGDDVERDWEWITEGDGNVCPICRPLNGKLSSVWRLVAPGGPPAHPRCRCDLILRFLTTRRFRK